MTNDERIKPEALEAQIAEIGKSVTDLGILGKFRRGTRVGRVFVKQESDEFTFYSTSAYFKEEHDTANKRFDLGKRLTLPSVFRGVLRMFHKNTSLSLNTYVSSVEDPRGSGQGTLVVMAPTDFVDYRIRPAITTGLFFNMPKEQIAALLTIIESHPDALDKFLSVAADGYSRLRPGTTVVGAGAVTDQIALVDLVGLFRIVDEEINRNVAQSPPPFLGNVTDLVGPKIATALQDRSNPAVKWLTVPKTA